MANQEIRDQAGLQRVQEELVYLKSVKRRELADKIRLAILKGDLSEGSDYDGAKAEQELLENQIRYLETLMFQMFQTHGDQGAEKSTVKLGSQVRLLEKDSNSERICELVGPLEINPFLGKVSADSPLGSRLLGCAVGDEIEVSLPVGKLTFKILHIQ